VSDCCEVETRGVGSTHYADCDQPGRTVDPITVKALLRPEALARLSDAAHRFCPTPSCPVVYFGEGEAFDREEIAVRVLQKEAPGDRTVCYWGPQDRGGPGRSAGTRRLAEGHGRDAGDLQGHAVSLPIGEVGWRPRRLSRRER
jgi:hypothetical protein